MTTSHVLCRVCGSSRVSRLCDTFNETSATQTLHHYACSPCGSVFVGNRISSEELGVAYSTIESKRYYAEVATENLRKMSTAIGHLKRLAGLRSRVIDLGTGNGMFVEMLRTAGFERVSAQEIPGADLSRIEGLAEKIYFDFDYSTIPSGAFDVVSLLDVVEHVVDPRYLLRACARILRPGGLVYFHTPVVTRTDRFMHVLQKLPGLRRIGILWQRGRTSIFHLQNYTEKSLRQALSACGFRTTMLRVKNELSWPVARYVENYLLTRLRLPTGLAPLLSPLLHPVLATDLLNANKAIVAAVREDPR